MCGLGYCALVRRKLLLTGLALVLCAAGGTAGAAAAFGGPASAPAAAAASQRSGAHGRESRTLPGRPRYPAHTGGTARPLLAVIGASIAAGVGAGHRRDGWPEDLARMMGWRLVVSADPGAGYVHPGAGHRGPFSRLAARLHLARLHPSVVIIQGGHDDIGKPLPLLGERVHSLVATVRRADPRARLALLTVFPRGNHPPRADWATDETIVSAARRADPSVVIFDPLAGHWHFPRISDRLHPTPAGHLWIADRLAAGLRPHSLTT